MAISPPFMEIKSVSTKEIDSTPLLIYGFDNASFVDSIWLCNTTNKEIFVSMHRLIERNLVADTFPFVSFYVLSAYESKEILKGSVLNMEPGDLLYGYTSYSGDRFTSHVSGRVLTEVVV